jgi:hypothetical protein
MDRCLPVKIAFMMSCGGVFLGVQGCMSSIAEGCCAFMLCCAVLQDNVPPFETSTALRILEENLGGPPSEVFAEFEETPIAAASLGQVRCCFREGEGVWCVGWRKGGQQLGLRTTMVHAEWMHAEVSSESDHQNGCMSS